MYFFENKFIFAHRNNDGLGLKYFLSLKKTTYVLSFIKFLNLYKNINPIHIIRNFHKKLKYYHQLCDNHTK